ncbi:Na+/H+ antiporter NhaA, partial [Aestuariibaculum lutulentum]
VLGVALGLFVGKQAGIFAAIWLADRTGIARRPDGVSWRQLYGLALIAGIGFTMSLFIGGLAFADPAMLDRVKVGVLAGSIASGLAGMAVLVRRAKAAA